MLSNLSSKIFDELHQIPFVTLPSTAGIKEYPIYSYPCRVSLKDGTMLERAFLFNTQFLNYPLYRELGLRTHYPWEKENNKYQAFGLESVAEILESPHRMPQSLSRRIYQSQEFIDDKGVYRFNLVLKDGRQLPCISEKVVDFLELPEGISYEMVTDILPADPADLFWKKYPLPAEVIGPATYQFCKFWLSDEDYFKKIDRSSEWAISKTQYEQLMKVDPTPYGIRRCSVTLQGGRLLDCVEMVEATAANRYMWALRDGSPSILIQDVIQINPSPYGIPNKLAKEIEKNAIEFKDAYCLTLAFKDGRRYFYSLGSPFDFIILPEPLTFDDVVEVIPSSPFEPKEPAGHKKTPQYRCFYTLPAV